MRVRLWAAVVVLTATTVTSRAQPPAPATPDGLVAAAKRAAGRDYAGTFLRICVAPDNLGGAPRPPNPAAAPCRAGSRNVVRAAVQSVRQSLFPRHEDSYRVGADHERWHHRHRYVVRLRHRARDRGGHDRARPRSARDQVRADQPRSRRSRSGRRAAAEPLRRQSGDGRGGLGLHAAASRDRRRRRAEA